MHISEPAFAVQEHLADGRVIYFDDPGCWALHGGAERERPAWFHHSTADRWLARESVGMRPVEHTPMGFGYAAVEQSAEGAVSVDEAASAIEEEFGGARGSD